MTLYQNNMAVLTKRFPALAGQIDAAGGGEVEAVATGRGDYVPVVIRGEKRIFVHSKFDPAKEAERFIGEIDPGAHDLFIVLGFGFGYHIEKLMSGAGPDSLVLVIERNPLMVRRALESRDLSRLVADERLVILLDPGEDAIAGALRGRSSRRTGIILHRGSYQADPEYYSSMQELARSFLSTKDVNIATLARFEKAWASNIARNITTFIGSPGAAVFYDRFRDVPAIVVAAGPSLTASIDFIRHNRDRAVIIAVDTAYRILRSRGIEPHFCLVVDPQVVNARYFEGSLPGSTVLIADPTVHPSVFRLFRGRVAVTGVAFQLMKWMERICGEKGEIAHGGSVSTNAYDFAKRLGASPVILTGQDLAFTGGYAHARGSYLDEQVHLRTGRLSTPEMFNRFQLTALPKIMVRGIRSAQVHTNQKMMIFLSWFEKRKDPDLVNATPDGALIPGVRHQGMDEIIGGLPVVDIFGRIDELYRSAGQDASLPDTARRLRDHVRSITAEIDSLLPLLGRAVGFSDTLVSLMNEKRGAEGMQGGQGKLDYVLKKLSEADRAVESKKHAKDMISVTIQRVIHTITEGYEIEESGDGAHNDAQVARRSRYLYRGLLEGAQFNGKILKKMTALLDRLC